MPFVKGQSGDPVGRPRARVSSLWRNDRGRPDHAALHKALVNINENTSAEPAAMR
jgi:hypothetical protein